MKNNNISPKLKITCIIHSLSLGGMERVMASLLNSFAGRDNVEVSLLLIGRSRTVEFDISNKIKVHTPDFEFNPQQRNVSTFRTMWFIRKIIKEISPNTILNFGDTGTIWFCCRLED